MLTSRARNKVKKVTWSISRYQASTYDLRNSSALRLRLKDAEKTSVGMLHNMVMRMIIHSYFILAFCIHFCMHCIRAFFSVQLMLFWVIVKVKCAVVNDVLCSCKFIKFRSRKRKVGSNLTFQHKFQQ